MKQIEDQAPNNNPSDPIKGGIMQEFKEALLKYGSHLDWCPYSKSGPCECGWSDLLLRIMYPESYS
jgi:hypothetical protein